MKRFHQVIFFIKIILITDSILPWGLAAMSLECQQYAYVHCDLHNNFIPDSSCLCLSCGQSAGFCLQTSTADSPFWSSRCKAWRRKGYCIDLFQPGPTPIVTLKDSNSNTDKPKLTVNLTEPTEKIISASNGTKGALKESSSVGSSTGNRYAIALSIVTVCVVVSLVVGSGFVYRALKQKRASKNRSATTGQLIDPANSDTRQSKLHQGVNDQEDIELDPFMQSRRNSYNERSEEDEVEILIHDNLDAPQPLDLNAACRVGSTFGSANSITRAATAQEDVRRELNNFGSGQEDDATIQGDLQDPDDVNSMAQSDSITISQYGNQMDSSGTDRCDTTCNSQETGSSDQPELCSLSVTPIPAEPKVDCATLVRATQDGDPQQLRDPPTPGENLPLNAERNPVC